MGENGLSANRYCFCKGLYTTDAVLKVVEARRVKDIGCRTKDFCALIAINIQNAFKSLKWPHVLEGLQSTVGEFLGF